MLKQDIQSEIDSLLEERGLIPVGELAKLLGVTPPAMSNWRKRFSDFPQPIVTVYQLKLFDKAKVLEWAERHDKNHGGSRTPAITTAYRLARRLSKKDQLTLAQWLLEKNQ